MRSDAHIFGRAKDEGYIFIISIVPSSLPFVYSYCTQGPLLFFSLSPQRPFVCRQRSDLGTMTIFPYDSRSKSFPFLFFPADPSIHERRRREQRIRTTLGVIANGEQKECRNTNYWWCWLLQSFVRLVSNRTTCRKGVTILTLLMTTTGHY